MENLMISTPERRYHFEPLHPVNRCGCGRKAIYELYEHHDPTCQICMEEAIDSSEMVPVRFSKNRGTK